MILVLSPDAAADIATIVRYTKREWGPKQARRYGDGLIKMLRLIADRPEIGRPIHNFPDRFMKVTYQSHHIYFVVEQQDVVIVRVMHQARDAPRHIVF